ncbi:MAG: hypothetical protein M0010_06470 [Actinomycetota bacterium]|nr:hypothetical protein [Actinomycetota bacterium]
MALGSNGSRTAPQPGSVRGAFAFGAAGDDPDDDPAEGAVAVVGVGDDTVATVRARSGCAVEGAADAWQPAARRPDAATSATVASVRRAAGLTTWLPPASRR